MRWLFAVILSVSPAFADTIRPADEARYNALPYLLAAATAAARDGGAAPDVAVLDEVLAADWQFQDPAGDWNCRTLKLGGITALTVYPNFKCRITDLGDASWQIEKLTGSQRQIGTAYLGEAGLIYLGVGHTGDTPAVTYGDFQDEQSPMDPGQTVPQVGVLETLSTTRARLMLPAPLLESDFDILYLTR